MKPGPNPHFAVSPYRAELFNEKTGWSGVMNAHGINCLIFPDKPGAVITDYETAKALAEEWNHST